MKRTYLFKAWATSSETELKVLLGSEKVESESESLAFAEAEKRILSNSHYAEFLKSNSLSIEYYGSYMTERSLSYEAVMPSLR